MRQGVLAFFLKHTFDADDVTGKSLSLSLSLSLSIYIYIYVHNLEVDHNLQLKIQSLDFP